MDILQEIATNTGILVAELQRIRRQGKEARKEMKKQGCTEEQIERGLARILDETMNTKVTSNWN